MPRCARVVACLWLLALGGCALFRPGVPELALRQRVLPPEPLPPPADGPVLHLVPCHESAAEEEPCPAPGDGPLSLEDAIALALRTSPTLAVLQERVAQAEAGRDVRFADFLPQSRVLYRHIEGAPGHEPFALPTLPTNLVGNVAFGGQSDRFDLAELHVQWTICDFGRRLGRYGQARAAAEIAALQYQRACQTVAYHVAVAYFAALQARANYRIAEEAVRRAAAVLRDARNFERRGTAVRNDVLRAESFLAEMRLSLVRARTAEGVAVAGLNQAIGINVSTATQLVDRRRQPPFNRTLGQCLQLAVDNRKEFAVALEAIRSARLGAGAAAADFLPRVVVGGVAAHQSSNPHKDAHLAAGGLTIELDLFQGGKRLGKLRGAEAEAREAVASGKEVCDRIAYEVNVAYLGIADALERIRLSEAAVAAAAENLRVVVNLFRRGDATPTDVVDAELAMTRAQQQQDTALYDYEAALARLAYATGLPILEGETGAQKGCMP